MKNKKKQPKKLELDTEVIADLESDEREMEAIHGGNGSKVGSRSASIVDRL